MPTDCNNGNARRAEITSGSHAILELRRERQLDLIGGEDLSGSGFEGEEPEKKYGEEG